MNLLLLHYLLQGGIFIPLKTKRAENALKVANLRDIYIYIDGKCKLLLNTKYILKILIYFKAQIARFVPNVNGIDTQILTKNV